MKILSQYYVLSRNNVNLFKVTF